MATSGFMTGEKQRSQGPTLKFTAVIEIRTILIALNF